MCCVVHGCDLTVDSVLEFVRIELEVFGHTRRVQVHVGVVIFTLGSAAPHPKPKTQMTSDFGPQKNSHGGTHGASTRQSIYLLPHFSDCWTLVVRPPLLQVVPLN